MAKQKNREWGQTDHTVSGFLEKLIEMILNDATVEAWLAKQRWGNEPTVHSVAVIVYKLAQPIQRCHTVAGTVSTKSLSVCA